MIHRLQLLLLTAALVLQGCSSAQSTLPSGADDSGGAGSGGSGNNGGSLSSGGSSAQAGSVGTAGSAGSADGGTAGAAGSGGQSGSTSGSSGSAGAAANGGQAGVAGSAGTSGSAGSAGNGGQAGVAGSAGTSGSGNGGQAGVAGSAGTSGSAGNGGQAGVAGSGGQAGVAGSGGQAGSAGGSSYHPCPTDGSACKILPLGDSITWGLQYDGAYRVELFTKAVAAGKKITFTGSLSNGPGTVSGQPFPKNNEGHSGWTISTPNSASGAVAGISGLIPSPALNTPPHIILLMIGTNDIYATSGQAQMPDRLGALLDKIIAAAPNALLVVAKITPLSNASWNATIKTYNDAIPALVQSRAASGKHIQLADMNTGFTQAMLSSDGIHPQKSGYDFMGDAWYAVISSVLP